MSCSFLRPVRHVFPLLSLAIVVFGLNGLRMLGQSSAAPTAPMEGSTTDPAAHAKIGLKPPANPKLPTLFLVGDSTVRNGHADGAGGQWGWGEPLVDFFDTTKINVDNRAIGGRSSRSYIMENQWAETLALVKPGDIILFQWGHNDDGPLDDPARARGTLHGIGDETQEIEYPAVYRAIAKTGYDGYIAHEFIPKGDPLEALKRAFDACAAA